MPRAPIVTVPHDTDTIVVPFAVDGAPRRTLSSAMLGGGFGSARAWVCGTVAADYARTDPEEDLRERARAAGVTGPIVGMLTAVPVVRAERRTVGCATAVATVGIGHALAASGPLVPWSGTVGTINILVVVDAPLDDAALVNATQTLVEAKVQALVEARIPAKNGEGPATGTATDAVCVAAFTGGTERFAGPATAVGNDIARAVHGAVLAGALVDRASPSGMHVARDAITP